MSETLAQKRDKWCIDLDASEDEVQIVGWSEQHGYARYSSFADDSQWGLTEGIAEHWPDQPPAEMIECARVAQSDERRRM